MTPDAPPRQRRSTSVPSPVAATEDSPIPAPAAAAHTPIHHGLRADAASATMVIIAPSGPWPQNPAPVTITSGRVVRRLAALVNGLPVSTAGVNVPCPLAAGFTLTFRAAPDGPVVAVADGPAECGAVHLRLNGPGQPDLQPSGS